MPNASGATSPRRFNSRAHGGRDVRRDCHRLFALVSIHAPTGGATSAASVGSATSGFQFTRPRGARPVMTGGTHMPVMFQFTRPRGARPEPANVRKGAVGFNSRAHGGRDKMLARQKELDAVSIHAPTGGATMILLYQNAADGFNSRAHGGRDLLHHGRSNQRQVSIHAPTGGATLAISFSTVACSCVSIHAPTGGATRRSARTPRRKWTRFNSRAHGGRDLGRHRRRDPRRVSIHAPTGGATLR